MWIKESKFQNIEGAKTKDNSKRKLDASRAKWDYL